MPQVGAAVADRRLEAGGREFGRRVAEHPSPLGGVEAKRASEPGLGSSSRRRGSDRRRSGEGRGGRGGRRRGVRPGGCARRRPRRARPVRRASPRGRRAPVRPSRRAPVGVGARRSAAWSMSVQSVSCPTAEISGMAERAAARTTPSSLKPQRSSRGRRPRATIRTSGRGTGARLDGVEPVDRGRDLLSQVSPWTRTGQTRTWSGKRSAMRWRMSRITAPVGEVTTADDARHEGQRTLPLRCEQPLGLQLQPALVEERHQRAGAGRLHASTTIWYFDEPGKVVSLPVTTTSSPSSGLKASLEKVVRQTTARAASGRP